MSKAFTKDDAATEELVIPPRAPLPEGVPNYVTPRGLSALRAELVQLGDAREKLLRVPEGDVGALAAPLARALLGKRCGEAAIVRTPRGDEEVEVLSFSYEPSIVP